MTSSTASGRAPRPLATVGAVANYFLEAGKRGRVPITHLKLQKLVSIAYGFYLAVHEERLFGERIEAWHLGPVVPELYHEFKRFGHYPITNLATSFDHRNGKFYTPRVVDPDALNILSFVWDHYGRLLATDLVKRTHAPGTPWHTTWARSHSDPAVSLEIPDDLMGIHYRELGWKLWGYALTDTDTSAISSGIE